jgi:hypothetical protein
LTFSGNDLVVQRIWKFQSGQVLTVEAEAQEHVGGP